MTSDSQFSAAAKVLVLEDEPLVLMLIEAFLREFGYSEIHSAPSLERARCAIDRDVVDIALLDIELQSGNSYGFAAELQDRGVPIVFVSAGAASDIPGRFADVPFIDKPFEPIKLKRSLQQSLSRRPDVSEALVAA